MIIDLTTAQACRNELQKCRREMEMLYDSIRNVYIELSREDADSITELAQKLYAKMNYTEQQILNLRSMIRALDSIISVYDRTERKNIGKAEGINIRVSDVTRVIDLENFVPSDIAQLFR